MRLLLDTHAALWWLSDAPQFSDRAAQQLVDERHEVLLSAVVIWEVAIKRGLGKLRAPADLADRLLGAGAQALPITLPHAAAVEQLAQHHRDPFDRLLIAQAMLEDAAIVTADTAFGAYDVATCW